MTHIQGKLEDEFLHEQTWFRIWYDKDRYFKYYTYVLEENDWLAIDVSNTLEDAYKYAQTSYIKERGYK